jgi:hypothetical protein
MTDYGLAKTTQRPADNNEGADAPREIPAFFAPDPADFWAPPCWELSPSQVSAKTAREAVLEKK